ncbi:rhomboid family intramembrane serine protease [Schlesneria paludicola]|uniref:rhomboid family intramembrane serine protease n=1 Tax=Schlesneria paludicola TaxID=360056 RepID=UPI00029AAFE7|nr:rhomboid family intramembrane serine protease [Schlesneria paludicola]
MRQIGSISDLNAVNRFADHLRGEGIACSIDEGTGGYRIWVHHDDHVEAAKQEFLAYLNDPEHQRYRDASNRAMSRIRDDVNRMRQAQAKTVNVSDGWRRSTNANCPLTILLIVVSLLVVFKFGLNPDFGDINAAKLLFSTDGKWTSINHGEVWRLITPIFLHFGPMHLIFNMIWTYQLGTQIEPKIGSFKFLLMVIVIAALSNAAQFWFHPRNLFGGMSGVVYGLFGYIWVRGKLEPESGLFLPQQTITFMLLWHVLCSVGVIPNVANWAHGGGLLAGVAIAFLGNMLKPLWARR